jgi:hypothetical protein
MTSTIAIVDESVQRQFDNANLSSPASTIELFCQAVTSLNSFESAASQLEEYVSISVPVLFKTVAAFKKHGKEIKRAIVLGITDSFELQTGSKLRAHQILDLNVVEADRLRSLTDKQRRAEKNSEAFALNRKLSKLVVLINKRAHSKFNRMIEKYFSTDVTDTAIVPLQVRFELKIVMTS